MRALSTIAIRRAVFGGIVLLASGGSVLAEGTRPAVDCRALLELTDHSYSVLSVTHIEPAGGSAARCRVLGMLPPEILFEVALPDDWNGRILMSGNGGYAGTSPDAPNRRRRSADVASRGYVAVYTNTGHDRTAEPLGTFALNDRQKEIDYSFRAVRLTIQTAKELTRLYYGKPPSYTYWEGCSTGGRQGLMAAQRFPKDFDGIVVGAPVLNFTDTQIWGAWNARALDEASLSLAKVERVAEAVYRRCDATDGLEDGLLEDPRNCDFDPARDLPSCDGESREDCFTPTEAGALSKIYGGVMRAGARPSSRACPSAPKRLRPAGGRDPADGTAGSSTNRGGRGRRSSRRHSFAIWPSSPTSRSSTGGSSTSIAIRNEWASSGRSWMPPIPT